MVATACAEIAEAESDVKPVVLSLASVELGAASDVDVSSDTTASGENAASGDKRSIDLSLPSALSALTHHLTAPLAPHYSHGTILALRSTLTLTLTALFEPTWREEEPTYGSGSRSLICTRARGLPKPLKQAAAKNGIAEKVWRGALHKKGKEREGSTEDVDRARKARMDEWEAWCDPGQVSWRYGAWEWFDSEFDPIKTYTEPVFTIWRATSPILANSDLPDALASLITPARPSAAIRIRAPNGQAVSLTPTPSRTHSGSIQITRSNPLAVPAPIALSPSAHIRAVTSGLSLRSPVMLDETPSRPAYPSRQSAISQGQNQSQGQGPGIGRQGHRACSESTSSVSSESSLADSNTTQLLTPASRPGSADPFSSARGGIVGHSEDGEKRKIIPLTLLRKDVNKENEVGEASGKKGSVAGAITPVGRGRDPSPNAITASSTTLTSSSASSTTVGKTTPLVHSASTGPALPTAGDKLKADPTSSATAHSPVPTVTPYDGGNVTVLGGGVKLGGGGATGGSRAGSVMSQHRIPYDRARSPSISLASRALNTALSPGEMGQMQLGNGGGGRKPRTRRRIMPTYLGYVGQPGVGGPVPYAFQNMGMGMMGAAVGAPPGQSQLGQQVQNAPALAAPVGSAASGCDGNGNGNSNGNANASSANVHVNVKGNVNVQVVPTNIPQMPAKAGQWNSGMGMGIGMPPVRQPLQRLA